jgi:flavin reductase (DIM6/NTAB) family NADH-FMN oxidoreductase RutF
MSIDIEVFKISMRRLAAGVCIITTEEANGARAGMTATAVCSVSASPPTLLCCINRTNASYDAISRAGVFAVNVLAFDDRQLADRFALPTPAQEKFSQGLWLKLATNAPVLESALVGFDCRVNQAVMAGTHGIFLGDIQAVHVRKVAAKPLLYAHGAYGGFESREAAGNIENLWIPTWDHEPH